MSVVARSLFAGTHLENAPQWLLEIEAMFVGGWKLKRGPKVRVEPAPNRQNDGAAPSPRRGRRSSVTPHFRVDRHVRIAEPRAAPIPGCFVRHHHFEHRVILASAKGSPGVAERRAGYGEGFNAPSAVISADVRATSEASYAEGHRSTEAERVVYITATNGEDYDSRMQFWQLANENAHFVGEHTITVATAGLEPAWDRACRDATMPDILREAIAKAKAADDGTATTTVNDAGVVKRWLKKRTLSFPAELRPHLELETPHNSRIAQSIIGQFPHNMSLTGMQRSLDLLVGEFTARKIPCQAVIHEPTAKNSKKNWHFHLIHYAGPAEQLPDGHWSFERVDQRDKWGTMKSMPLKRIGRNDELAAADWVPKLKRRWSEIVNTQAISEGVLTRFTNETNQQRGLPKPQVRYSPGRQALHKQGYFTDVEIEQNIATWSTWRKKKRSDLADITATVRHTLERVRQSSIISALTADERAMIDRNLAASGRQLIEADTLADTVTHAKVLGQMISSGPKSVIDHYAGVEESLASKNVTPSRAARRSVAHTVCTAAHTYLAEQGPVLAALVQVEEAAYAKFKAVVAAVNSSVERLETQIDLTVERASMKERERPVHQSPHAYLAAKRAGDALKPALINDTSKGLGASTHAHRLAVSDGPREHNVLERSRLQARPLNPRPSHQELLAGAARLRRGLTARWLDSRPVRDIDRLAESARPNEAVRRSASMVAVQFGGDQGR